MAARVTERLGEFVSPSRDFLGAQQLAQLQVSSEQVSTRLTPPRWDASYLRDARVLICSADGAHSTTTTDVPYGQTVRTNFSPAR